MELPVWIVVTAIVAAIVFIVVAYCIGLFAGQARHHCIGCRTQRVESCGELCGPCTVQAKAMGDRIKPSIDEEWARYFEKQQEPRPYDVDRDGL